MLTFKRDECPPLTNKANVGSRAHVEAMIPTIKKSVTAAGINLNQIDAIAVTSGPGLAGALVVGVAAAKALAVALNKPIYGVNHLASHVAVDTLENGKLPEPSPCAESVVKDLISTLFSVLFIASITTFTQGLASALKIKGDVTSPTFVIAREHKSLTDGPNLVHVDAYRLNTLAEISHLDLVTDIEKAILVVEWGKGLVTYSAP